MANYLKLDSEQGYVSDHAEIDYLIFNNMRHAVLGCMMGDFDSNGIYSVDPEIVSELIDMKKYIVDSDDNVELCVSQLKLLKQITFLVTFEGNRATLSLIEKINYESNVKINSGSYSNINEFILDSIETSGEIDRNIVYRKWNISPFEGEILDVFKMDDETLSQYLGIVNRFKYIMSASKIMLENEEKIENVESEYASRMIDVISHYPELKKVFDEQLKTTLTEKAEFIKIDKPYFAKTINEVINNIVKNNIDVLSEEQQEEFSKERHNEFVNYNIKVRDSIDLKIENKEFSHSEDYINQSELANESIQEHVPTQVTLIDTKGEDKRSLIELAQDSVKAVKEIQEHIQERVEVFNNKEKKGEQENDFQDDLYDKLVEIVGQEIVAELKTEPEQKEENKIIPKMTEQGQGKETQKNEANENKGKVAPRAKVVKADASNKGKAGKTQPKKIAGANKSGANKGQETKKVESSNDTSAGYSASRGARVGANANPTIVKSATQLKSEDAVVESEENNDSKTQNLLSKLGQTERKELLDLMYDVDNKGISENTTETKIPETIKDVDNKELNHYRNL